MNITSASGFERFRLSLSTISSTISGCFWKDEYNVLKNWCPRYELNCHDKRFRKPLLYPTELRGMKATILNGS